LDNGELDQDGLDDFRKHFTDRRAGITEAGSCTPKGASHHMAVLYPYDCIQKMSKARVLIAG